MINKLLLFVCLIPGASIALQDDATQTINIKAQAVLIDEKKGISIYTGKASVVQGSLILSAEKIQLFSNQTQVTKMIANGDKKQRAHYQQSQPTQPRFIEATANKITYMVQKEMVHLKGNAHLVQGFDSFSGGSLDYDIKKDKVIANKSKDGLQRVRFKIKL